MFNLFDLVTRVYPSIDEIRATEAWEAASKGDIVLIDVRDDHEIARFGRCKGAIHIPLHMVRHKANPAGPNFDPRLDPAQSYALYCENGVRSLMAARIMKKQGYSDVYNMGAFREWLNGKLPVEK